MTFFYRLLSSYSLVRLGMGTQLVNDADQFWIILSLLTALIMVVQTTKLFLMSRCIINSSTVLHSRMVNALIRSPCSFFDSTPTGNLTNKFSSDLSVIDYTMFNILTESIEGRLDILSAVINVSLIDLKLLPAALAVSLLLAWLYFYSKPVILSCKQL